MSSEPLNGSKIRSLGLVNVSISSRRSSTGNKSGMLFIKPEGRSVG